MTSEADPALDPRFAPIAGVERSTDDVRVHRLADGAWILRLPLPYPPTPFVNTYLLASADGYVLVDCGTALEPGWESLERALSLVGVRPDELALLVTTHSHSDHAALAATVIEQTGCRYARLDGPQAQMERMRDHWVPVDERRRAARWCGVPEELLETWIEEHIAGDGYARVPTPDLLLQLGDNISSRIGDWTVHSAAGHSSSMSMLWNAERRWLVSGDLILQTPFQYFEWGHLEDPFAEHLASLHCALALDPDLVLPGHGRPIHQHVEARIRFSIEASEAERDLILELVEGVPRTPYALSLDFVPDDADLDQRQAGLSVVVSVLDHLEAGGRVASTLEDGVRRVSRAG